MKTDSVIITPIVGYRTGDRQSHETLQWLASIGPTRNISHAGNGRQFRLARSRNVKVEGKCEETNEAFENQGCFWHGCLCMLNRHKPIGKTKETLENTYE